MGWEEERDALDARDRRLRADREHETDERLRGCLGRSFDTCLGAGCGAAIGAVLAISLIVVAAVRRRSR